MSLSNPKVAKDQGDGCPIAGGLIHRACSHAVRMWGSTLFLVLGVLGIAGRSVAQVQINVGAGQAYTSIQAAVNQCPLTGCVINLTDKEYALPREIWIEAKTNLVLQASEQLKALKVRPRLYYPGPGSIADLAGTALQPNDPARPAGWRKWPVRGTSQTGPGAAGDNINPFSTSGFQHNGYVVVYKSSNVVIDGIMVDGIKPEKIENQKIWDNNYDIYFGNVGINLFESKKVVVRNTEIKNCFAGFYMQNRNVGGAFASPNPNDLDAKSIVPYSQYGKMGDHVIERSYVHHNWYVIYDEMEWDIGSTIRYNLFDQNFNPNYASVSDPNRESNNMTGGFMFLKDVRIVPHKIHNNTINGSSIIFGNSYFKPGVQHYFYDNLVTGWKRGELNNSRQLLSYYREFLFNNTFEVGDDDKYYQMQDVKSAKIADVAACTAVNQNSPCWLNWDVPLRIPTGIQNQWLWNGWKVAQGVPYTALSGGNTFTVADGPGIDMFGVGGLVSDVQGLSNNGAWSSIRNQANFWARQIPYKSLVGGAKGFLEPDWSSSIVDSTVQDKGWLAVGGGDLDGSIADRGAISASGEPPSPALVLRDQFIVTLDKNAKTVSFQYCLDASGAASNLQFEMTNYYKTIALTDQWSSKPKPEFPAPLTLTNLGAPVAANSCGVFRANLPVAPVDSFARFDLVVKGSVDGKPTKSNVGVWLWRQTQYRLDVYFTRTATDDVRLGSIRVGEPVYLHAKGLNDKGAAVSLDVLAATPDRNMILLPGGKQVGAGDTLGRNLSPDKGVFNVVFTSTSPVTVAMAGLVGTLPVPGAGAILVRPGPPDRVVWRNPSDWRDVDRSLSLDAAATAMDQAPSRIRLQVIDAYGNAVDSASQVEISAAKIDNGIFSQGFAATTAGPFATPVVLAADATGKVDGFNMVTGLEGQKYWGFASVKGSSKVDSALMKVGKPRASLFFVPAGKIDTFVNVAERVHLILSKDAIHPEAGDAFSNTVVKLRTNLGSKVFASSTGTVPLDSVALVDGAVDLWIRSALPIANDALYASNPRIGNGSPAVFAPISFRMPPRPPAPSLKSAVFLDGNCDGTTDSVVVRFDPTGAVPLLDPSVFRVGRVKIVIAGGDSIVLDSNSVHLVSGGGALGLSLPASLGGKLPAFAPTGQLQIWATSFRAPAADTVVSLGTVSVSDGIGPRPTNAVLVENTSPSSVPDTLVVQFSEPVLYAPVVGKWPLRVFDAAMQELSTTGLTVMESDPKTASTTIKFVITGNTRGVLREGAFLAIDRQAGLTDLAGNDSRFASCATDLAKVSLKPVVVGIRSAALLDANGDGMADRIRIVFRRDFRKAQERPDSVLVSNWEGTPQRFAKILMTDSVAPATFEIGLAPNFPLGATIGSAAQGAGVLEAYRGVVSTLNPVERVDLIDSVPPIAVGVARLEYDRGVDRITVSYSEPMELANPDQDAMVLKTPGGDVALTFTAPTPDATGRIWTFEMAKGKLDVGDKIRLPMQRSMLRAKNGGLPAASGNAPYVPVVGGDRAPDSGLVLDRDGDGVADAVRLFYKLAPRGNPRFGFDWQGKTVSVDSLAYASTVAGRTDVTIPVANFAEGTSGGGEGRSISFVGGVAAGALPFPLKDGVAPVLVSAWVAYGAEDGAPDTMRLGLSESGIRTASAGSLVLAGQGGIPSFVRASHSLPGSSPLEFILICTSPDCKLPGFGDKVRLGKGAVTDSVGAVVGDSSRWVPVLTGPRPTRYKAAIFPKGVVRTGKDVPTSFAALEPLSLWIQREGDLASWTAQSNPGSRWGRAVADSSEVGRGLVGVKLDLNSAFDGQFIAYDNIGTFVGTTTLKLELEDLKSRGLVDGANRYSILVALNGFDPAGKELASGVYMIRVITFTSQTVNGVPLRRMQQNRVYRVGVHNGFK